MVSKFNPRLRCFISAAINLAGNAIGAAQQNANTDKMIAAQKAENEAARQWNSAEAQKNRDWQENMWNLSNKYNSLSSQRARAQKAGMNPDLMYGSGATNVAANTPSGAQAEGVAPADMSAIANKRTFGDAVAQAAQNSLIDAQRRNIEADTQKKQSETKGQDITNKNLDEMLTTGILSTKANIDKTLADAGLSREQTNVAKETITQIRQTVEQSKATVADLMNQISNRNASQAQQWIRICMEKALNDAEIQKRFSEIGLNRAQTQRLVTLLPSELANLDSQTLVNNETAALTFLKQGTEAIIRAKYKSDTNKQDVEIKRLNTMFETEKAFLDSLKSDDGEISTVGKAFLILERLFGKMVVPVPSGKK